MKESKWSLHDCVVVLVCCRFASFWSYGGSLFSIVYILFLSISEI